MRRRSALIPFERRLDTLLKNVDYDDPIVLVTPPPALCTGRYSHFELSHQPECFGLADNAVMIGWASMHRFLANDHDPYSVEPLAKWSLEDLEKMTHQRVVP